MDTPTEVNPLEPLADAVSALAALPSGTKEWTETERAHALAVYAETNSLRAVERHTGVPASTVGRWVESEGGMALINQLRTALRSRAAWRYAELVERAQSQLLERLEHGDPHVTKDGNIVYHPVKARDLMLIASVSQDKHALLTNGLAGSRGVDKALASLADKLLKEVKKQGVTPAEASDSKPVGDGSAFMG